ncbi:MAG: hypothetical protein GC203_22195 [Phenylobacterium sp.]|uniref:hypothetical protein n=1 Tax=Phenylobacterium sp. TaxID=1871053 RepID=UPI0025E40A31|nr:hypothetical protein [Phenylobacterium sp.]MBI1200582.1 hypothetical protein [Phenylobacterium sp.]
MRALVQALSAAFVLALSAAPAALAAPTCVDAEGRPARCGSDRALPVGETPPPEVRAAYYGAIPRGPSPGEVFSLVCVLGGLMALFVLLPDFEDGEGGGWNPDEDG